MKTARVPPSNVRRFEPRDVPAAAELLAARDRRDRGRFPILPAGFESADACAGVLSSATEHAEDVVAEHGGQMTGFLFGVDVLVSPSSGSARYAPQHGATAFAHGHAVAHGEDPFEVCEALYSTLDDRWVGQGLFGHTVHVPAGNPGETAWLDLGFGREAGVAARDLRPVDRAPASGVEVRCSTPEDLKAVMPLEDVEPRHHAGPPIWRPYVQFDTVADRRAAAERVLAGEDPQYFVAIVEREPAGLILVGEGRGSPLFVPDGAAYIGETAVIEERRSAGVGIALVDRALDWARDHDYRHATRHYATATRRPPASGRDWASNRSFSTCAATSTDGSPGRGPRHNPWPAMLRHRLGGHGGSEPWSADLRVRSPSSPAPPAASDALRRTASPPRAPAWYSSISRTRRWRRA